MLAFSRSFAETEYPNEIIKGGMPIKRLLPFFLPDLKAYVLLFWLRRSVKFCCWFARDVIKVLLVQLRMKFPVFQNRSSQDPEDALGRMDRAVYDRNHRLSAGLSVSAEFGRVQGALILTQGNGKFLRIKHVVESSLPIPESVASGCREVVGGRIKEVGIISQFASDLAEIQANVIERLKCQAGRYVDRVLAVSLSDPGVWDRDFDGKISYSSFSDAAKLAEICGVSVIDAYPSRDLAVGGTGKTLESLPYWMMLADRNSKIASESRFLVSVGGDCHSYFLPASDGLDAEVPLIQRYPTVGVSFLELCFEQQFPDVDWGTRWNQMYVDGLLVDELLRQWHKAIGQGPDNPTEVASRMAEMTANYLQKYPDQISNVVRTGIRFISEQCIERLVPNEAENFTSESTEQAANQIRIHDQTCSTPSFSRFLVDVPQRFEPAFLNQFSQLLGSPHVAAAKEVIDGMEDLQPVVAAVLGLLHIDQMPANVPWLSGADCQRILGRVNPGRPSNWRQLIRAMADFQPAPMKLKDAI